MELVMPDEFESATTAYGYTRTIFEEVASGRRPAVFSISPSVRHVGVTKKDTHRPGFGEAVRLAHGEGYPVALRGAGGGAIAAGGGDLRLLHHPPGRGRGPEGGDWEALRRGCLPGARRAASTGGAGGGGRGARRILPRRPEPPGRGLRGRHEARRHSPARNTLGRQCWWHRARLWRGGAGARARALLWRDGAAVQAGQRGQPAPGWKRGYGPGGDGRLRRGGDTPLRGRADLARRAHPEEGPLARLGGVGPACRIGPARGSSPAFLFCL